MENNNVDARSKRLFEMIGYEIDENTYSPVYEINGDRTFIKFMSEKGVSDKEQADAFERFLVKYTFDYVRVSKRSFQFVNSSLIKH